MQDPEALKAAIVSLFQKHASDAEPPSVPFYALEGLQRYRLTNSPDRYIPEYPICQSNGLLLNTPLAWQLSVGKRMTRTAVCREKVHLEKVVQGLRLQLKKAGELQRQDKSRAIQAFC